MAINMKKTSLTLRYNKPAPDSDMGWEKYSLPLGCGVLGASVFGGVARERIQITENSLANPMRLKPAGTCMGLNNFAETYIEFPHRDVKKYTRKLSIDNAVATISYDCDVISYKREYFTSYPDKVLVMRFTASEKGRLNLKLCPEIPYIGDFCLEPGDGCGKSGEVKADGDTIVLSGMMEYYKIRYCGIYKVINNGGELISDNKSISVKNADSVVVLLAVGTNYHLIESVFLNDIKEKLDENEDPFQNVKSIIDSALQMSYETLLKRHKDDYKALFGRVDLTLTEKEPNITTDKLLRLYKLGIHSKYLEQLYFQYGRYLLISSSRQGCLPANLQGIWNVHKSSPWSAGYWHNINVQMNYWPAFNTNLIELFEPYAAYNEAFRKLAQRKADEYLTEADISCRAENGTGENGWCLGTGAWPYNIEWLNPNSHSGPGTGGFTAILFWEYFAFSQKRDILREHTYPALLGMAKFLSKVLVERDGRMLSYPSASPEQQKDGKYYHTIGCTFDQQMIYENAKDTVKSAELLGIDNDFIRELREQLTRLDPVQIGASGQVKEYREENKYGEIGERYHRHISHLVGLYPGTLITSETPEWLNAAKVTLKKRGDRSTGRAMAHRLNLWARTGDGEHSYKIVRKLISGGTLPNLWDTHPPFQIDGNFGGTAGIAEMLLQSHESAVSILPSLPTCWKSGSFKGLTARGGYVVSAEWKNMRIISAEIFSRTDNLCRVRLNGEYNVKVISNGAEQQIKKDGRIIEFNAAANTSYTLSLQ